MSEYYLHKVFDIDEFKEKLENIPFKYWLTRRLITTYVNYEQRTVAVRLDIQKLENIYGYFYPEPDVLNGLPILNWEPLNGPERYESFYINDSDHSIMFEKWLVKETKDNLV